MPTERGPRKVSEELGVTGLLLAQGGTVEEEFHPNLIGRQALRVWKDMSDNDPTVGAILFAIDKLLRQVEWITEEGDSDQEGVEFLDSCLDDMTHSFPDMISEILSMLPYGFSFHEIVYKLRNGPQADDTKKESSKHDDGKIGWARLPIRAQDSLQEWMFDRETGRVTHFVQQGPPNYKRTPIPLNKGLLFRTTSFKENPEGRSLLRNAYRPWFFKNRIEVIEGVGIERDMAGFPVIRVPAKYLSESATDNERQIVSAFKQIGANMRRDKQEYVIMPTAYDEHGNRMFDIELMSAGGTRQFDTSAIVTRYDQRIAMTVLADFILLGHEKVGSFALSSDKTDLFAVALGTILDTIQAVFNRHAIPRLWKVNNMDPSKTPKLKHGDIEDRDLQSLGTYLSSLSSMGMTLFPDDDLDKHLRKVAHLPERSEEALQAQQAMQQQTMDDEYEQQQGVMEDESGQLSFGNSPAPGSAPGGQPGARQSGGAKVVPIGRGSQGAQ